MELASAFTNVNWLSVLTATLLAFALGALWYSPVLFGDSWAAEHKLTEEELKNANMPIIFGGAFVLNFIAAFVLDMFIGPQATLTTGLIAASLVSIAWITTAFGINYLFARKSMKLFMIDSGYFIVFFAIMGIVLGAW